MKDREITNELNGRGRDRINQEEEERMSEMGEKAKDCINISGLNSLMTYMFVYIHVIIVTDSFTD